MVITLKYIELAILEMKGMYKRKPSQAELDKYFSECGGPWEKADNITSWCGIFATYLLRKSGAEVKWVMGQGIHNESNSYVQRINSNEGICLGDIAVRGSHIHHFIVTNSPDENGTFNCVEGNYGGVGNPWLHHGKNYKNNIRSVDYYYRVF